MQNTLKKYFILYLSILFFFSLYFLYTKHEVGNDSTISEWFINYSGGFTKRGIIGQISIFFSSLLKLNLRDVILFFQILIILFYYIVLYFFIRLQSIERYYLLALFSPIFLLYPVAEIEVLARKEIFIFILFIIHTSIPIHKSNLLRLSKLFLLPLSVLIWEPVVFFLPFWILFDLLIYKFEKIDKNFIKEILFYLPTLFLVAYFIFSPMTSEQHAQMALNLKNNYNEICYMSCALLNDKSTIYQQFQGNFGHYSIEVFVRYFFIILIGFGPLFVLLNYSKLKKNNLLILNKLIKNNVLLVFLFLLSPALLLFAMGYDWGRWVHISYVLSFISFVYLLKNKLIDIDIAKLKEKKLNLINKKTFAIIFLIFCFTWNPKTAVTGDIASIPIYRIPYKFIKINFLE